MEVAEERKNNLFRQMFRFLKENSPVPFIHREEDILPQTALRQARDMMQFAGMIIFSFCYKTFFQKILF